MLVTLPVPDAAATTLAERRWASLAKPGGALGRLEELAVWLAGVQGTSPPRSPERVRVVVFAGDHGIAAAGVSAYPSSVTPAMVAAFAAGGAAVSVLARTVGATVRVEDVSVGRPSGRIDREDAISEERAREAYDAGAAVADAEVDAGADLLIAGDMGIANTTPAAVICAALTGSEPVAVVGRGTGIDDDGWMIKAAAVRDALTRVRRAGAADDPLRLLAVAGGADLTATTGFLVRAAERRTPVVLDGVVPSVCALLGDRVAPGLASWQVAGTLSTEPAQRLALSRLHHEPLLDLGLRLGEGTGALLAVPLLRAAVATLAEMSTLDEVMAGVGAPPVASG